MPKGDQNKKPKQKEMRRRKALLRYQDPVYKKRWLRGVVRAAKDPDRRLRVGAGKRKYCEENPAAVLALARRSDRVAAISTTIKNQWNDPTIRTRREVGLIRAFSVKDVTERNLKIAKSMKKNKEERVKGYRTHRDAVFAVAGAIRAKGYKVLTCWDAVPDIIAVKGRKILFGEVETKPPRSVLMKKARKYLGFDKVYDKLIWYDLNGNVILEQ
jgi:hypothetical protein